MFNFSKSETYLYWAVMGLLFDFRNHADQEAKIISELAKRTFAKIKLPINAKLLSEYKNMKVAVYTMCKDDSELLNALDIKTHIDNSDNVIDIINLLIKLGEYEKAKSLCLSELNSSAFIDSRLWNSLISLSTRLEDGFQFIIQIFKHRESPDFIRDLEIARIELKLAFEDSFPENVSEMLFSFTMSLKIKPSAINDVIYFIRKMNSFQVELYFGYIFKEISLVLYLVANPSC